MNQLVRLEVKRTVDCHLEHSMALLLGRGVEIAPRLGSRTSSCVNADGHS